MALSTGERIRLYRTRRGLSRERLSGLAGVSPSWLKQVENGTRKADSLRLLVAVAEALNMPVWDLIPGPRRLAPDGGPQGDAVTRLENALLPRVFTSQHATAPDLSAVRTELDTTWTVRNSGRFAEAAERLAVLIPAVEAAVGHHADDRRALKLYAEVHWLTAYTLFRAGERGKHSRIAADRFVTAARRVGDPLLMAASARCLSHVLLHSGEAEAAGAVARDALDALASGLAGGDDDYLSVYGALLLAGALAAARLGDGAGCRRLLGEAEEPARRVGDVDRCHTTFGPTNLLIHAVSCARELGDFVGAEAAGGHPRLGPASVGTARRRQRGDRFASHCWPRRTLHHGAQAGSGVAPTSAVARAGSAGRAGGPPVVGHHIQARVVENLEVTMKHEDSLFRPDLEYLDFFDQSDGHPCATRSISSGRPPHEQGCS